MESADRPAAGAWPQLEAYTRSIIGRFGADGRVLLWDLYNEPGNADMGDRSLPLLDATFGWTRATQPQQPLTVGIWHADLHALNETSLGNSDIISFHNYNDPASVEQEVQRLQERERPLLCTEWMRRSHGSLFATHLPFFKRENVGCYFWGLVNGKTQTHFAWGSPPDAPESEVWFHDLLRRDGTPHITQEIADIEAILR